MTTTLETIARWATRLDLEQIPERVIEKAKLQILSMIAAVYSAYPNHAVRAIREVALGSRANGRATVLPSGDKTSPTMAVMANAAASMALDFDDYLFMGHSGHSAVLATLAQGEEQGIGGRDMLRAQIAANELAGRLGASVILGPQNGQLWTHIHAAASALAGALILGLDETACAHALALSLYQPPMAMWPGFMGPDSKLLSAAFPARDGLYAARLASWGLTGPLDILDSEQGFGSHFAIQFLPQMLTGWGQAWVTDSLCYKIYPGCAYIDAALDALIEVSQSFTADHDRPLEPADVLSIDVGTTLLSAEMQKLQDAQGSDELTPVRINFSLPESLAVALRAGGLTPAALDEKALQASAGEIRSLAAKIKVGHDWTMTLRMLETMAAHVPLGALISEIDVRALLAQHSDLGRHRGLFSDIKARDLLRMTAFLWERAPGLVRHASRAAAQGLGRLVGDKGDPAGRGFDLSQADFAHMEMPFCAKLALTVRGGQTYEAEVTVPRGACGRDFDETKGLVRKKFRETASRLLSKEQADAAISRIEHLEEVDDLCELTAMLKVGGPGC